MMCKDAICASVFRFPVRVRRSWWSSSFSGMPSSDRVRWQQTDTDSFVNANKSLWFNNQKRNKHIQNNTHVFLMIICVVFAHCCLLGVLCYSWSLIGWRALQRIRLEIFLTTLNTMPKTSAGEFASIEHRILKCHHLTRVYCKPQH